MGEIILEALLIVGCVIAFGAAYAYLLRRAALYAQPARLRLAKLGEQFLANPEYSDDDKALVGFMLNNAFSPITVPIAIIAAPLALISTAFKTRSKQEIVSNELRQARSQIAPLFILSAAASSPLLSVIVALELVIFGFLIVIVRKPGGIVHQAYRSFINIERVVSNRGAAY